MAIRFIDSAAHYGTGTDAVRKWTIFNGSPTASGGRRGSPYINFGGGQGALKTLTHQTNWIQGAAALMAPGAATLGGRILTIANNQTEIMSLNMNHDATLSLLIGGTSTGVSTIAVADPLSWHYYEARFDVSASGGLVAGTATFYVDGRLFLIASGVSNIGTSGLIDNAATANMVGVSNSAGMHWMDYYCLDTSATDINGGTASTNTTFLGDVEIDALFPNADVTTQWGTVGGDGTHAYTTVNETSPDDDTSYILTTATTSTEAFTYQPISGFTGTILGAQYLLCARKDQEGVRAINLKVGTNVATSIEFLAADNYLSDFYVYYVCPLDTDFGTVWTPTIYNSATFGVIVSK